LETQQLVSREITQAMIANKQIIYVDETTFHQWMVPARAWVKDNMALKMPSSRGTSFSIVGAISERDGLVYAKIFKGSNDTNAFLEFVHELVQRIKGEALVYMDNYTVHHAKKVKEIFNARVVQKFFPAYSCALNPIERLWSQLKLKWRRKMITCPNGLSDEKMREELEKILR
jgi:transposase